MSESKTKHRPTRYKITIAYDGTEFAGWQVQPGKRTVQLEIEQAIAAVCGEKVRVHQSGRTDAGVHAKGQVAHFDLKKSWECWKLQNALNASLPDDVRIMKAELVASDFHARFDTTGKEYRYFIWNGPAVPPHLRLYRLHERRRLNLSAMREAAAQLVGKHDFASFTANPKREIDGTVRTIHRLDVSRTREGDLTIRVEGDGFLYKMVRSIAGFLLRVGTGELIPDDAGRLLHEKKRTREVLTAKPLGLFLWRVDY